MSNPTAFNPAYPFVVYLTNPDGTAKSLGIFSEVVGLMHKVQGINKISDVTLKRGVVNSGDLWNWLQSAHSGGAASRRDAIVSQQNQANTSLRSWRLANALPAKYDGPTLGSKGTDVAIEELILAVENIQIIPPH